MKQSSIWFTFVAAALLVTMQAWPAAGQDSMKKALDRAIDKSTPATEATPAAPESKPPAKPDAEPAEKTVAQPEAAQPSAAAQTIAATRPKPAWVDGGCENFLMYTGLNAVCAIGSSKPRSMVNLCEMAAISDARAKLAQVMVGQVQEAIAKAGCATGDSVVNESKTEKKADGTSATSTRVRITLHGVRLGAAWASAENGCMSIVTMDQGAFFDTVFDACGSATKDRKKIEDVATEVWNAALIKK